MKIAALVLGGILILFVPASFAFKWEVPAFVLVMCAGLGVLLVAFASGIIDKLKVSKSGIEAEDA